MVSENYACAYKEVIEILKHTKREDVNKIPKLEIILWKQNMKEDYDFKIDSSKPIEKQNLSQEAKAVLANIFKKYWADDYQRERIENKEKYCLEQIEKEKYEKYNPENIFKNKNEIEIRDDANIDSVAMVKYEESIFKKIINKIKSIFRK